MFPELVIILVVVLLIFGPKNLPNSVPPSARGVKSLRNGLAGDKEEAADEVVEEVVVVEKVEKLESASEEQAAKPKVKRVVKKVAAE